MSNHAYNKTAIVASLILTFTGLFSSIAGADPTCAPDNLRWLNIDNSPLAQVPSDELVEPTDAQFTELPDKILPPL